MTSNIIFPLAAGTNIIRRESESNTFGPVRKNADGSPRSHQGWDLYAPAGTPAFAVGSGKVEFAGERGDLGLAVLLKLDNSPLQQPTWVLYAHMSSVSVKIGDVVQIGSQIGRTGNTGNASSMRGLDEHLHFEVRLEPWPGLGLSGRVSPLKLFGKCPLQDHA